LDDKLARILKIQSIDIRFDEIGKEKERIPKELEKRREDMDCLNKTVEGDLAVLERMKVDRRKIEKDLDEVEARHKKSKMRLDEVKSNKEYQAVIKELDDIKALTGEKEELVIQKMEDIEIQETECERNNAQLENAKKEYEEKQREFEQIIKEFEKEAEDLTRQKSELSRQFDDDLLDKYTRLRAHLKGRVVVPVINAVCQGCHIGIPPQQYNLLLKGDSTQICPHCGRVIYWEGDGESE
jgi:uncharacterized protein